MNNFPSLSTLIIALHFQILVEPVSMFTVKAAMNVSGFAPAVVDMLRNPGDVAQVLEGLHLVELDFVAVLPLDPN